MRRDRAALLAVAVAAGATAAAPAARASYDPPLLVSSNGAAQGADASERPALSGDGRYVAFSTRSRNLLAEDDAPGTYRRGGILRRDAATGALDLVARGQLWTDGALVDVDPPLLQGALAPSISADGRYVAFSTDEPLVPQDANGAPDVYVRDMDRPIDADDAYTLASAIDGTDAAPAYDGPAGVALAPRVALSDDGRSVAFVTQAGSDLLGPGTPADEVLVRRLDARRTLAASTAPADARPSAAALSGDGTTVAWLTDGPSAARQAAFAAGDDAADAASATVPLVRRLDDGSAPRVITGKGDPEDPGCPAGGSLTVANPLPSPVLSPCDGPLVDGINTSAIQVAALDLSRDGRTALVVTNLGPRGILPNGTVNDVYLVDLRAGVSRKAALNELTREGEAGDLPRSLTIDGAALSGDGRFVALTTGRTRFATGLLRFAGTPSPSAADDLRELYVIDAAARTVQLVTRALDGGKSDGSSSTPDVDDAGDVAFASTAGTLVDGDGNGQQDAFLARPHHDPPARGGDVLGQSSAPWLAPPAATAVLRLTATATARGDVRAVATVPGPGSVRVTLKAAGARKAGATGTGRPALAGPKAITLRLSKALRHRVLHGRGLQVTLTAAFTPRGGARLTRTRTVRVRYVKPKAKRKTIKKAVGR